MLGDGLSGSDGWTVENLGVDGTRDNEFDGSAADAFYDAGRDHNILCVLGGANDINQGANAATTYARLVTFCQARQSAGWEVVILTLTSGNFQVGYDAEREAVNVLIRANWRSFADALADQGADSRVGLLGAYAGAYFSSDPHLNDDGYGVSAGYVAAAVAVLVSPGGAAPGGSSGVSGARIFTGF